ncbi:hypothetical protein BBOV_II006210 [Babesia bovis T2Bo]|uniref:Uncharacterized protein n=1 Tax=Babesia bovis TaxID=5865 RepID=A7AUG0_BABBO|nr:hypothetical protein BBOV_II006210 [Babesia bovis T2Bo]EDO06571.1 hypothetical protein BBOV_II006210 [Babesia bovis T2Bo]|eukprot:XP_001610139.1 hypothetical protein [Babesia bovis T2Bo]
MGTNGMNMSAASPLGCCKPKDERRNVTPVFRQQYINDNGKMKLTMPLSPLHYITSSNYYANDHRMPIQHNPWEQAHVVQQMPYPVAYEQQVSNTGSKQTGENYYVYNNEPVGNKRMTTPSMHIMTQTQYRQQSAQVHNENSIIKQESYKNVTTQCQKIEPTEVLQMLTKIEERIINIESTCKQNADKLDTLVSILENVKVEQEMETQTMISSSHTESIPLDQEIALDTMQSKISQGSQTVSNGSINSKMNSQDSYKCFDTPMPSFNQQQQDEYGSKVFDVSQELKKSNDMIERFLSGGSATLDDNRSISLQHESMELSMLSENKEPEVTMKQEYEHLTDTYQKYASSESLNCSVKPIVTTASMIPDECRKSNALDNLGRRFQMLMHSLEQSAKEAAKHNVSLQIREPGDAQKSANNVEHKERQMLALEEEVNNTNQDFNPQKALSNERYYDGTLVIPGSQQMALQEQASRDQSLVIPGSQQMALQEQASRDQSLVIPGSQQMALQEQASRDQSLVIPGSQQMALQEQQSRDQSLVIPGSQQMALQEQQSRDQSLVIPGSQQMALQEQASRDQSLVIPGSQQMALNEPNSLDDTLAIGGEQQMALADEEFEDGTLAIPGDQQVAVTEQDYGAQEERLVVEHYPSRSSGISKQSNMSNVMRAAFLPKTSTESISVSVMQEDEDQNMLERIDSIP